MHSAPDAARPLPHRIRDTFLAPRRLAAELLQHATWGDALLISTLVAVIAAGMLPAEFFLEQVENPVTRTGRPVTVTSPPEEIVRWGRRLQMFSAAVEHPVIVVMAAGLLTLVFSVVGGGAGSMRQYLALTSHAFLISALGVLLTLGWQLLSGDRSAQPSLALLFGGSAEPAGGFSAVAVLEVLNPFTLWTLGVLAVGVSELDRRRSLAAVAAILIGLYVALAVGVTAVGSGTSA